MNQRNSFVQVLGRYELSLYICLSVNRAGYNKNNILQAKAVAKGGGGVIALYKKIYPIVSA